MLRNRYILHNCKLCKSVNFYGAFEHINVYIIIWHNIEKYWLPLNIQYCINALKYQNFQQNVKI